VYYFSLVDCFSHPNASTGYSKFLQKVCRFLHPDPRDILAFPITTVASESAISTSGRLLSDHRTRLTPKMMEALMCSQSWLRHTLQGELFFIFPICYI
jgi:hypothetical protein